MARVTRDDVARRAGTSTAVVSYVINDGPRPVAGPTRERVLAAMAELGYRPNALARGLSARRTNLLGLIVPDAAVPFFAQLAYAVEQAAAAADHLVLVGNTGFDAATEQRYVRAFDELSPAALILIETGDSRTVRDLVTGGGSRVVMLHRKVPGVSGVAVVSDNRKAGRLAARHLIDTHGHREIGCLTGADRRSPVRDRERGVLAAFVEAGLAAPDFLRCAYSRAEAYELIFGLLAKKSLPRALVVTTDEQALGVLAAADHAGVRVPEELAVVSIDGIHDGAYAHPPLTTVAQDVDRLAAEAVAAATEPAERAAGTITVPVTLTLRRSCGC
jgi:LacI family transcriptional regulator